MGQKLSDLKFFFGVMEEGDCTDSNVGSPSSDNFSDNHGVVECGSEDTFNPTASVADCSSNSSVPEANGVNDHFESIYSNGTENIRSDGEIGNMQSERCVISASYACPAKVECVNLPHNEPGSHLRRGSTRTLSFVSGKRSRTKSLRSKDLATCGNKKKRNHWVLKFNCARLKGGGNCGGVGVDTDIPEPNLGCDSCVCTGYRRTEEHHLGAGVVFEAVSPSQRQQQHRDVTSSESSANSDGVSAASATAAADFLIDMSKFNPEDYPIEDCDERARLERAREIAEGVEPPPGFCPGNHIQLLCPPELTIGNLTALFHTHLGIHSAALTAISQIDVSVSPALQRVVHTQVDYIHCLVPDLLQITSCSFYWGKMDRYEAERLLEGRPEGTFLLRDSAQEEYLFSVSFRKYGRSLHARIEQWNHHFSFDSHDPGVFASPTVCGLIEHYKDPSCCMFFEPMLTFPLHRNFPFPLQHLCRAVVCSRATYDGLNKLHLPKSLKCYLKEYHYKQRVRVRRFDLDQ
ncbi:uncharacterized protein Socs36E [Anabrus simplex]|uniref:uncharacterized protein Socs36E n=1 Tax=Anabrus simplex TaxID=316456 RepID=UPI0035A2662C